MRRSCVLATVTAVALVALAAPSAGAQTTKLPVGQADGVRIVRVDGAIVVVFTARAERLWRRVAGKRVSVMCEEWSEPDEFGNLTVQGGGTTMRAPRRGRRIRTGDLTRGMDFCEVSLEPRTVTRNGQRVRLGRELIVAIPLTQKGAVRLDEKARARALFLLVTLAGIDAEGRHLDRYPTPAELLEHVPLLLRPVKLSVVPLASPSDTPPAGSIGYYSDGAHHVATVVLSATGRRLFFELDVDETVRTNVIGYIFGDE
jgi:hypothetical protein